MLPCLICKKMNNDGSSPAVAGSATSENYSRLKRNSSAESHHKSLNGSEIDGGHSPCEYDAASCSADERVHESSSAAEVAVRVGRVESPRSEGSGESLEVVSSGAMAKRAGSGSLGSMDTLELAHMYLQRKRATQSESASEGTYDTPGLDGLRTLGDGAEMSGGVKSAAPLDLGEICDQLRQRDETLELAARLGQELLERNAALESDLLSQSSGRDQLQKETTQLQHEISVKEKLLRMYYDEMEDEDERAAAEQQERDRHSRRRSSSRCSPSRYCLSPARSLSSMSNVSEEASQMLQAECEELRSANKLLAEEATLLHQQAALLDQREQELISECVRRLNEATQSLGEMQSAHQQRQEVAAQHGTEIASLRDNNDRMRDAYADLSSEKQVLQSELERMSAGQSKLAAQVGELQEQYVECLTLFREAQEELAMYRKHATLPSHLSTPTQASTPRQRSIGSELSVAMQQQTMAEVSSASLNLISKSGTPSPLPPLAVALRSTSLSREASRTPDSPLTPTGVAAPMHLDRPFSFPTSPAAETVSPVGHGPAASARRSAAVPTSSHATTPVRPPPDRNLASSSLTGFRMALAGSPGYPGSQQSGSFQGSNHAQSPGASPLLSSRTHHANQIMSAVRSLDHKPSPTAGRTSGVYRRGGQTSAVPSPATMTSSPSGTSSAPSTQPVSHRQPFADQPLPGGGGGGGLAQLPAAEPRNPDRRIYTAPEKLRIVKPMEGSLTLLKWKLLALQQHSGADVLQRALTIPGIHLKGDESVGPSSSATRLPVSGDNTPPTTESDDAGVLSGQAVARAYPRQDDGMAFEAAATTQNHHRGRVYSGKGFASPALRDPPPPPAAAVVSSAANTQASIDVSVGRESRDSNPRQVNTAAASSEIPLRPPATSTPTAAVAAVGRDAAARTPPSARVTTRFSRFPGIGLGGALSGFAGGLMGPKSTPQPPPLSLSNSTQPLDDVDGTEIE